MLALWLMWRADVSSGRGRHPSDESEPIRSVAVEYVWSQTLTFRMTRCYFRKALFVGKSQSNVSTPNYSGRLTVVSSKKIVQGGFFRQNSGQNNSRLWKGFYVFLIFHVKVKIEMSLMWEHYLKKKQHYLPEKSTPLLILW